MPLALLPLLMALPAHARPCDGVAHDGDVAWDGVGHDTLDPAFRAPGGAVPAGSGAVRLRLRTCAFDATAVYARVWDGRAGAESLLPLVPERDEEDPALGPVTWWGADLPLPSSPRVLYYSFQIEDGADVDGYQDDDPASAPGGWGGMSEDRDDLRSFQITVYDPAFRVPAWLEGAVFYQIFPDRFRDGDPANNPVDGTGFSYGWDEAALGWGAPFGARCTGEDQKRAACYAGGDLAGITAELDGLAELGVTALYLNPIFRSATNHRYDTVDYMQIDDELGDGAAWDALAAGAQARGMKIVLDGVFNHVSADSVYFDLYGRWDAAGALTSPAGPGANDGSGACESTASPYRSWFWLPAHHNAARTEAGETVWCQGPSGLSTYEAWGGYYHLPKLDFGEPAVRDWIYAADDSVARHWLRLGAGGWRLDVGGDVDPGQGHNADNTVWEEFRAAVKATDPEAAIIGEHWSDPAAWMVGGEWDSVMNYRLRSALLDWVFDACAGLGCDGGRTFRDNDSIEWRDNGTIEALGTAALGRRLLGQLEDVPPPAWNGLMNLLGSHDVSRISWVLRRISGDDAALAREKLRFLSLFLYAWPGAPTVYYGDEVGVVGDSEWDGWVYQDDPFNRVTYPWAERGGSPDLDLRAFFVELGQMRAASPALRHGDLTLLHADDADGVFAFSRRHGDEVALAVLRRAGSGPVTVALPDGAAWGPLEPLFGEVGPLDPASGAVTVELGALQGAVWGTTAGAPDTGAPDSGGADGADGGADGADGGDGGAADGADGGSPDAGPGAEDGGGERAKTGCSSAPSGGQAAGGAWAWAAALLGLVGLSRRRR
jgi:MYXO-CTERM domain-containing protein